MAPVIIVAVQVLIVALISPQRDFPVQDDWAYAKVVQSILRGQPQLSDFLAPSLVFHVYWGALWCAIFGFSFTVLTLANMVMSVLGALALYALLRELDFAPFPALVGSLTLLLNPITIYLSYSFQSNLTFMAALLAALWAFVAAWRRPGSLAWMALGGVCSAAAVLTRQVGVAAPLAAALIWGWRYGPRRGALGVAIALLPSGIAYGLFTLWMNALGGQPWAMSQYAPSATVAYVLSAAFLPRQGLRLVLATGYLGWFLLPVIALVVPLLRRSTALATRAPADAATVPGRLASTAAPPAGAPPRSGIRHPRLLLVTGGAGISAIYIALYAATGGYFNAGADLLEVRGYWPTLSGYEDKLPVFPLGFWTLLTVGVAILAAVLWMLLGRGLVRVLRRPAGPRDPALGVVTFCMLGLFALTFSSPIYHDEYPLTLLPGLIVFVLALGRGRRAALVPAGLALLFLAAFSLPSLREYYNWKSTAWRAGQALLAAGVAPTHMSGGIEWNYWYLWDEGVQQAHESGLPLNFEIHHRLITPDYALSFVPQPRTIVDSPRPDIPPAAYQVCAQFPYGRPLSATPGAVYILALHGCPAGLTAGTRDDRR